MSDVPTSKTQLGVQVYRWLVGIGTAATALLAGLILSTVRETAKDVTVLQVDVSTVKAMQVHQSSRIEAVERRHLRAAENDRTQSQIQSKDHDRNHKYGPRS